MEKNQQSHEAEQVSGPRVTWEAWAHSSSRSSAPVPEVGMACFHSSFMLSPAALSEVDFTETTCAKCQSQPTRCERRENGGVAERTIACVAQSMRTQQSACLRSCVAFFSLSQSGGGLYVNSAVRMSRASGQGGGRATAYQSCGLQRAAQMTDCLSRNNEKIHMGKAAAREVPLYIADAAAAAAVLI